MSVLLKDQKTAEEREARRVRHRALAIQELVETESNYVFHLQVLNKSYIVPLLTNNIINAEQHKALFGNIVSICKLHEQLSEHISKRYNNWDPQVSKISDIFNLFVPYFNIYQTYLINYEKSRKLISELCTHSSKFMQFINETRQNPISNGFDIRSYLCYPLGRIPRYGLILREIIKNTLSDHPDYKDLQQTYTKLHTVSMKINDIMKKHDQRQKLRDLETAFTQKINLVIPERYFIMQGELTKICKKKDISFVFILCSDVLIYGPIKKNKIKIKEQIVINESFKIGNIPQNIKYGDKCWEIWSSQSSFIVYAQNGSAKREWCSQMEKLIESNSDNECKEQKQKAAVLYVPDDFTSHCMMETCDRKFGATNKRCRCRDCGYLICNKCSTQKLPDWNKHSKSVTVCEMCCDLYK